MSRHLSVRKTVELLETLKTAAVDFSARCEKLEYDFRVQLGRARSARQEATEADAQLASTETAEAEALYQTAQTSESEKFSRYRARINRARASSKEQAQDRIEHRVGTRKYELQRQLMDRERSRDALLAGNVQVYQEFAANAVAAQTDLAALEKKIRSSFRGYGSFNKQIDRAREKSPAAIEGDQNQTLNRLREVIEKIQTELGRFRGTVIPLLFSFLPIWLLVPLSAVPYALQHFNLLKVSQNAAIGISAGSAVLFLALYFFGKKQGAPAAGKIADLLALAWNLHAACVQKSEAYYISEAQRLQDEFTVDTEAIDLGLKKALLEAGGLRGTFREKIDDKTVRVASKNEQRHRSVLEKVEHSHNAKMETLTKAAELRRSVMVKKHDDQEASLNAENDKKWKTLEEQWLAIATPVFDILSQADASARQIFPAWSSTMLTGWIPAKKFEHAAKFGELKVDVEKMFEGVPRNPRLTLPGPAQFTAPMLLTYPDQGSILFETANSGREKIIDALNDIILRLLYAAPPGRIGFTIIDPVGLGQNFAGAMHLADYGEQLINSKIWTQSAQIEEKLGELNEHMEKVIQMYLRNEYATIAEYNEAAGNIAERYQILVVADFPANFSDLAIKRLTSIATSGARCGVYTLIHWDKRQPAPQDFMPDELRKHSVCLSSRGNDFILTGKPLSGVELQLETPPVAETSTEFIHKVGRASRDSSRVEVPFSQVAPPEPQIWSEETTTELRVPIGRTGATKLQYMAIGKGTRQHALIAGKTGSGKSTLFHIMITNLALWCSPEQVEFYLVDFKKGVEFKAYASKRLPHARVVAIESDREFGLSVLQRVDDELRHRGEMFRKLGVQDIAGYKRMGGMEPVPRSLLMIDEFQELFVEDDKVSQNASVLLDRIVRQGRAFGIHVILGSQTLGGAYTVARTTLGQMVIRIALQCNEADAYLIMDENNPAPRLLTRPGEGIYNDGAGALEANSPFQAVWLSDEVRDQYLEKVREHAVMSGKHYPGPIVFEGDAPAEIRENAALQHLLEADVVKPPVSPRIWLGAPNSIKGPTEAIFHRQSGNNLLIVGQRDEAALAMMSIGLITLATQFPLGGVEFYVFDGSTPGSQQREFLENVVKTIPQKVTVAKNNDLGEIMAALIAEQKKRMEENQGANAPAIFLLFNGLQKFNKFRYEEDFSFSADDAPANPGKQLNDLIVEGATLGIHAIVFCDTYNNVNRFLSKKAYAEFEMRVLFQMSATDSANLSDSPKAGNLGLHRALFYNEQEGYLETFRPYALPDGGWLEQAAKNLARLGK